MMNGLVAEVMNIVLVESDKSIQIPTLLEGVKTLVEPTTTAGDTKIGEYWPVPKSLELTTILDGFFHWLTTLNEGLLAPPEIWAPSPSWLKVTVLPPAISTRPVSASTCAPA
jgi:hypothetical protein